MTPAPKKKAPKKKADRVLRRDEARTSFADRCAVAALFGVAALYFVPVLLAGNGKILSAVGTDVWSQFYYWRHFGFGALARGELPLWNPYVFSGTPYIAGIQSAIFYPGNFLYLVLGTAFATNLGIALHCFLASFFTYLYARYLSLAAVPAFFSAITFAYGAPYVLHIYAGHLSIISTMAWLPLLFLSWEAFLRTDNFKCLLLGALVLAVAVLAGHPQYLFYSLIAVGLYFILHLVIAKDFSHLGKRLCGFNLFVALGILLAAVQLLPALELTRNSVRESLSFQWIADFSLPPENLLTLLVPDVFGDLATTPYWGKYYLWEMSLYVGVLPLAAAAVALVFERSNAVKCFALIASIALVLAFGKHTPLLKLLYHTVPGFNLFRGVSKFVFVFSFAVAILAGFGLAKIGELISSSDRKARPVAFTLIGGAALLFVSAWLSWIAGQELWRAWIDALQASEDRFTSLPPIDSNFVASASRGALAAAVKSTLLLLALAGWLLAGRAKWLAPRIGGMILVGLTVLDLWHFGARYLVTFAPERLAMAADLQNFLQRDDAAFRIATPIFSLVNTGMLHGIENAGGYDAIVLKPYSEFINLIQAKPLDKPNIVMTFNRLTPLLRFLNVRLCSKVT
jgi:hypothetical protein